ncbi:E3 ubiquitin-protein ligase PDZRN3-like protein [Leptotrombidium deliense]|uniref:E3 ubiquitin-protein ligase PDZRN3-like protein n=1 Tax=Leptotrombidium deliense TaxID=299467 RepID=A0A443SSW9_9ACAR|nr:E3 ubiquitin-protein ligase PDZRN3-like protein [Leptotrombidium deliense]
MIVNVCNGDETQQSEYCNRNDSQRNASSCQETNGNTSTGTETHGSREVYVNKLETDGIAARDGKIKVGDQILEINGLEVKSAQETQALLETDDTLEFKIFVARTNPKHNHFKCRERAQQKRLQPFFKWCDDSHRNHVSLIDDNYDYCEMLLTENQEEKEDVKHASANNVDLDPTAKDEKDSGVGKTDGDSTCTRTNDTCSTDYELTLDKGFAISAKNEAPASEDHSDTSLDREMTLLQQEMANIQLECERLINRHAEQKQLLESHKENVSSPTTTTAPQKCESDPNPRQCDQINKLVCNVVDTVNKCQPLPSQVISIRKGPTPPPTPKHFPKPKQLMEKPKPPARKPISKATDLLPEMQPIEKKESIKRWIKSGIPTTPPSNRRSSSKLGICRSVEFSDKNLCDGENQRDGFTLQLSPVKNNDAVINQHRSGSMLSLLTHRKESAVDENVFMEDKGTQMQESDVASLFSCESCKRCCRTLIDSKGRNVVFPENSRCSTPGCNPFQKGQFRGQRIDTNSSEFSNRNKYEDNRNNYVTFYPPFSATMYTNKANLEHTILLQQELLRQALFRQQKSKTQRNRQLINSSSHQMSSFPDIVSSNRREVNLLSPAGGNYMSVVPPSPSKSAPISSQNLRRGVEMRPIDISNENMCNLNVEWKVKKRSDGSRYITRRPVRNKLLKERAMRIMQERSGLTTDDDTMSELKIGKYWTKDERKKQVEKAKDRKRKEMMQRAIKMGALREQSEEREVICFDMTAGNVSSGSANSAAKNKNHFKNATLGSSGSSKGGGSGGHTNQFATTSSVPSKNRLNELLTVTTV